MAGSLGGGSLGSISLGSGDDSLSTDTVEAVFSGSGTLTVGSPVLAFFYVPPSIVDDPIPTLAYTVYLRDSDLTRIGEIKFTELQLRLVFAGISKWAIQLPADDDIVADIGYGNGVIVQRNGKIILSGPIDRIEQEWSPNTNSIKISGSDDTILLQDRWASPVVTGPPYTSAAYDVRTGIASTIMRDYVNYNVGPGATVARQKSGLILNVIDPVIGGTITGRARFDNLLVFLQSLALSAGDLGFNIIQSSTSNQLIFNVYQPVNRTSGVIFSPRLGNLRGFNYSTQAAEANYVAVGGGGEGTARTFYEQGDSASITLLDRRIEQFVDRRDTTVTGELTQTAVKELASKGTTYSLSITPIDTESLSFGRDYNLGDKVTVVASVAKPGQTVPPSITIQDIVREINITVNYDSGEVIVPAIGTTESGRSSIASLFSRINKTVSRISNLERR